MNRDDERIWPVEHWARAYPHPADRRTAARLTAGCWVVAGVAVVALAMLIGAGWIGPEGLRW